MKKRVLFVIAALAVYCLIGLVVMVIGLRAYSQAVGLEKDLKKAMAEKANFEEELERSQRKNQLLEKDLLSSYAYAAAVEKHLPMPVYDLPNGSWSRLTDYSLVMSDDSWVVRLVMPAYPYIPDHFTIKDGKVIKK